MVSNVVTYLNAQLALLDYFEKSFCLCEIITKEEITFPAQYISGGQYEQINIDNFNGVSYWRKSADVSEEEIENLVGCEKLMEITIPLRLVTAIPKKKLSEDDLYASERVARTIIKQLEQNATDLRSGIQARKVIIHVESYNTENNQIVAAEYLGEKALDFKFSYIAFEVEVVVTITKACLLAECDTKDDDILSLFDFCDPAIIARLSAEQNQCIQDNICDDGDPATITDGENPASPVSVPSGGAYACFPCPPFVDVVITDNENPGSPVSRGSGTTYTCFPCPDPDTLLCADVNDNATGLTQIVRNQVQRVNPLRTGQTTSYAAGDDGDLEEGRQAGFRTLSCNNEFGNTDRFTDSVGGQTYGAGNGSLSDYIIDHFTGLAWYRILNETDDWPTTLATANAFAIHFTDWRLPNMNEIMGIMEQELTRPLSYVPFSLGGGGASVIVLWTSTTVANLTSSARGFIINHVAAAVIGRHTEGSKTGITTWRAIFCRNHY